MVYLSRLLSDDHLSLLIQRNYISKNVVFQRGYSSIYDEDDFCSSELSMSCLDIENFDSVFPGLLFSSMSTNGKTNNYIYLPDDGNSIIIANKNHGKKYEPKAPYEIIVDCPKRCKKDLQDVSIPLHITASFFLADSFASRGMCSLCIHRFYLICNGNEQTIFESLEKSFAPINLHGREVRFALPYDEWGDGMLEGAARMYGELLSQKGARVKLMYIPEKWEFPRLAFVGGYNDVMWFEKLPDMVNENLYEFACIDEQVEFQCLVEAAIRRVASRYNLEDSENEKTMPEFAFSLSEVLYEIKQSLGNSLFLHYQKVLNNRNLISCIRTINGFLNLQKNNNDCVWLVKNSAIREFLGRSTFELPKVKKS